MPELLQPALFAAALAAILVRIAAVRRLSMWAMDRPNDRSLHSAVTPRTGGIALFAAAGIVWAATGADALPMTMALTIALIVPSLLDDAYNLPVWTRFAAQVAVAVAFLISAGSSLYLLPILTIGLVWCMNLYNFMDGSDGLAGGMAAFGFSGYALHAAWAGEPEIALISAIVAGAACGFLVWNLPRARIFMGDAGSVPLGFLAGALGILGWLNDAWPPTLPLLLFAPFAIDATLTLARRLQHGDDVLSAHRTHVYQKIVLAGGSHGALAAAAYALNCALLLISVAISSLSWAEQVGVAACVLAALVAAHLWLDRVMLPSKSEGAAKRDPLSG